MENRILAEELEAYATEKQIYETRVQRANLKQLSEASNSGLKRPSTRNTSQPHTKRPKIATDSTVVVGLPGTLGENLEKLQGEIVVNDAKTRYFSYLSKNLVLDMTDISKSSHRTMLRLNMIKLKKFKYARLVETKECSCPKLAKIVTKIKTKRDAATCYKKIDNLDLGTLGIGYKGARISKNIYRFIVEFHAFKQHQLSDSFLKRCSEMSTITKYWSYLFETYFGYDREVFLQWGDTLSVHCVEANLPFRLDIRIVLQSEQVGVEAVAAEVASHSRKIRSKLYRDKLKSVLASKCNLNGLVSQLRHIDSKDVQNIHIPILQIMGLECKIYSLSLIDKKLYLLQKITSFKFPQTFKELRTGGIDKIMDGLHQLDCMLADISENVQECSRDTSSKMEEMTSSAKKKKSLNKEDWISDVVYDSCTSEDEDNGSCSEMDEVSTDEE